MAWFAAIASLENLSEQVPESLPPPPPLRSDILCAAVVSNYVQSIKHKSAPMDGVMSVLLMKAKSSTYNRTLRRLNSNKRPQLCFQKNANVRLFILKT
jgi:hypothetical protein